MEKSNVKYDAYIHILEEELVPAMGCTEPIAIAYGAANARRHCRYALERMADAHHFANAGCLTFIHLLQ